MRSMARTSAANGVVFSGARDIDEARKERDNGFICPRKTLNSARTEEILPC